MTPQAMKLEDISELETTGLASTDQEREHEQEHEHGRECYYGNK